MKRDAYPGPDHYSEPCLDSVSSNHISYKKVFDENLIFLQPVSRDGLDEFIGLLCFSAQETFQVFCFGEIELNGVYLISQIFG